MLNGLSTINVELTSSCNKNCWMCGRRKMEKNYPKLVNWGNMDFKLVEKIAEQIPEGIVVQFHNNGEPLLYPRFGEAIRLFKGIKCLNTNGKLLVEKADEIIDNLDTITISIIENDPEADRQLELIKEFLKIKGDRKPLVIYRCLGDVDSTKYDGIITKRVLHHPLGSFKYKKDPTKPETGICGDMLNHLAIDRFGEASICVRFDPEGKGVIGDANTELLKEIWNSPKRKKWLKLHIEGKRNEIPLCKQCEFWGVPTAH